MESANSEEVKEIRFRGESLKYVSVYFGRDWVFKVLCFVFEFYN